MNVRSMAITAILIALAIIIPLYFGFLKVTVGPFTATVASHVPVMLSVFVSPWSAILVGVGSTIGFLLTTPLFVAARAATHIVFGGVAAWLYLKGWKPWQALLAALPIHALLEGLVVLPFGFSWKDGFLVTALGTVAHHTVDLIIALFLLRAIGTYLGMNPAGIRQGQNGKNNQRVAQ